ncbi:Protease HtpX [Aquisphaera giovannonii]|uniref:Protease HtpX n=1 Tax=Aquisphaera giovannonii TaxID=406548 RepID=A0A5B9VWX1_9BACT|nr:M48 family metallopeptidase [Aquisphaera giovannonii]QEH32768.1 Protease HtpX [Aquisphaera giovannonii]
MKREAFDDLVRWVEARYAGRPRALERAVVRWVRIGRGALLSWIAGLLGGGVALCVLGVVVAAEAGAAIVLLALGAGLLAYCFSQAGFLLLAEPTPRQGHLLGPGEAPELRAMLDELRRRLDCRPFDEIRVSLAYNASVLDVPRLGFLGLGRSTLEIGLPLAMVLSPDELRSIFAHEFAHLSARHGMRNGRIYRLHRAWCHAVGRMQSPITGALDGTVRGAVMRFLGWYWPRLHARAVVLSRLHEFHADRVGAEVAGAGVMAGALWRTECRGEWISERFWPDLHGLAGEMPEPPDDLFDRLRLAIPVAPSPADAARWIGRALAQLTAIDSSHPALPERLRALGQDRERLREAGFPAAAEPSAASLIGATLPAIERELAEEWRRSARASWRDRHRWAAAEARRASRPEASPIAAATPAASSAAGAPAAIPPADDPAARAEPEETPGADAGDPGPSPLSAAAIAALWDRARESADHRGPDAAVPILEELLRHAPDHVGGTVMLGHCRLRLGDAGGERLLLRVVDDADENWMKTACELLAAHYRETGRADRLREVRARLDAHEAAVEGDRLERASVGPSDDFLPHGLDDDALAPLLALLAAQPTCAGAWLARKRLRSLPRRPLFVLCLGGKAFRWGLGDEPGRVLVQQLSRRMELPGQVLVISRNGGFRRLAARIMKLPGSRIYPDTTADG